jgi:hypothetical protein
MGIINSNSNVSFWLCKSISNKDSRRVIFNDSVKMPMLMIAITVFVGAVVGTVSGWFAARLKRKLKVVL